MRYNSDTIREGGAEAVTASDAAGRAAGTLSGVAPSAGAFGNVNGAGDLAGALSAAREHHLNAAQTSSHNSAVQGARARTTAALGDENTVETTNAAVPGF